MQILCACAGACVGWVACALIAQGAKCDIPIAVAIMAAFAGAVFGYRIG